MPRMTDQQYILFMQKAARIVNMDLCISNTDDRIVVDSSGCVTPVDDTLNALLLLQTECLISQRDFNLDLNSGTLGVRVVDGEQQVDTRNRAGARSDFFNSEYSACAQYEKKLALAKLCRLDNSEGAGGGKLIW